MSVGESCHGGLVTAHLHSLLRSHPLNQTEQNIKSKSEIVSFADTWSLMTLASDAHLVSTGGNLNMWKAQTVTPAWAQKYVRGVLKRILKRTKFGD